MTVVLTKIHFSANLRFSNILISRLMSSPAIEKPVESAIRQKLKNKLEPIHLDVLNESHMHNVPRNSETHFKVLVVSEQFENVPLIKRHRIINGILEHELNNGVHALSIVAIARSQWDVKKQEISPSPACKGGFGK